jgi:hypothetical protein
VYPVSEEVSEVDLNTDVEEFNYDGRLVYRGNLDELHSTPEVSVYWLYDENSKRVGLAEHAGDEHTALWFKDTPFGTLLQEDWVCENKTVWSLMTQTAYEDCMKWGWTTIEKLSERTRLLLVTPDRIINGLVIPEICSRCLGIRQKGCLVGKRCPSFDIYSSIFLDEDGVIYTPPSDTEIYATLRRRAGLDASEETAGSSAVVDAVFGAGD